MSNTDELDREWHELLWFTKEQIEKKIAKETFNSSNIERIFRYRILQDWLSWREVCELRRHGDIEIVEKKPVEEQ